MEESLQESKETGKSFKSALREGLAYLEEGGVLQHWGVGPDSRVIQKGKRKG